MELQALQSELLVLGCFPDEVMELCYDRVTPQTMEHANQDQDLERDAADRGKDHIIRITHSSKLSVR